MMDLLPSGDKFLPFTYRDMFRMIMGKLFATIDFVILPILLDKFEAELLRTLNLSRFRHGLPSLLFGEV